MIRTRESESNDRFFILDCRIHEDSSLVIKRGGGEDANDDLEPSWLGFRVEGKEEEEEEEDDKMSILSVGVNDDLEPSWLGFRVEGKEEEEEEEDDKMSILSVGPRNFCMKKS
jgi:hypothetical protein